MKNENENLFYTIGVNDLVSANKNKKPQYIAVFYFFLIFFS